MYLNPSSVRPGKLLPEKNLFVNAQKAAEFAKHLEYYRLILNAIEELLELNRTINENAIACKLAIPASRVIVTGAAFPALPRLIHKCKKRRVIDGAWQSGYGRKRIRVSIYDAYRRAFLKHKKHEYKADKKAMALEVGVTLRQVYYYLKKHPEITAPHSVFVLKARK